MGRLVGYISLLGMAIALIVHGATFFGCNLAQSKVMQTVLNAGAILGIFVVMAKPQFDIFCGRRAAPAHQGILPEWAERIQAVFLFYATINFVYFMFITEGNPMIHGSSYVLQEHGKILRTLTFAEYKAAEISWLRMLSGGWLAFYFRPVAYFLFRSEARPLDPDTMG